MVKQKTWILIYPNKEESITNYNPIKEAENLKIKEEIVFLKILLSKIIRNSKGRVQEIKKSEYYQYICSEIKSLTKNTKS